MMAFAIKTFVRVLLAVIIGAAIGSERARHGRSAGMRTHILVCIGACMTSLTSIYVTDFLNLNGDVFRIPAQVISGISFLGAGMIILKSNNMITGLTTAAGIWTTATIGIALGYGYYLGSIFVTALFLITTILFARFEHKHRTVKTIYIETDNPYKLNDVLNKLKETLGNDITYQILPPKSGNAGFVGINLTVGNYANTDIASVLKIEHVVFATEE